MASRSLCFLLLLLASSVLARPNDAAEPVPPTLDVTSSVSLGHPLLGDSLGPFPTGTDVDLICSSSDGSLVLSWWESGEELTSQDVIIGDQGSGSSISLEALSVSDNGRRLTCKAEEKGVEKSVLLQVENTNTSPGEESDPLEIVETPSLDVTGTLDILVNKQSLEKDQVSIDVKSGDVFELICVLQGHNTPILSWLENDVELVAQSGRKSSYASSSVLTIKAVSATDSGRRFSCRSEGGSQERVVEIQVHEDNTIETMQIFLICICVGGTLLIVVMATVVGRLARDYKEAVRSQQVSKVSDIFKKYSRLPNLNGTSRDPYAPQLVRGPYKPCTILLDPEGNEY